MSALTSDVIAGNTQMLLNDNYRLVFQMRAGANGDGGVEAVEIKSDDGTRCRAFRAFRRTVGWGYHADFDVNDKRVAPF